MERHTTARQSLRQGLNTHKLVTSNQGYLQVSASNITINGKHDHMTQREQERLADPVPAKLGLLFLSPALESKGVPTLLLATKLTFRFIT